MLKKGSTFIYFSYKIPRYSIGKCCLKYFIVSREYLSLHSLHWKAGDQFLRLSKPKRNENMSYLDISMSYLSVVETAKKTVKKQRKGEVFSWIFADILSVYSKFHYLFCYQSGNPFFAFTAPER